MWFCWLWSAGLCGRCGEDLSHCHHPKPERDEIDRLWAVANEIEPAELIASMRHLVARYEGASAEIVDRSTQPPSWSRTSLRIDTASAIRSRC
jgi:hypothetical protein